MAVFTPVSASALAPWLRRNYRLELAGKPRPITAGIENSNYEFDAGDRRYILTILEVWDAERAAYCLALAAHLADKNNPAPRPLSRDNPPSRERGAAAEDGGREFAAMWDCGGGVTKPAAVLPFVVGAAAVAPDAAQCEIAGQTLARLHQAAVDFPLAMPNPRGRPWREQAALQVMEFLPPAERRLLRDEIAAQQNAADSPPAGNLPRAACHCDFFRDNVLWRRDNRRVIAGVIDFYFSGEDDLIFDLAIAANDWCRVSDRCRAGESAAFAPDKLRALLDGYQSARTLSSAERAALPFALRAAALRFWLSRLTDIHYPRRAQNLSPHDPAVFRDILLARRADADAAVGQAAPLSQSAA